MLHSTICLSSRQTTRFSASSILMMLSASGFTVGRSSPRTALSFRLIDQLAGIGKPAEIVTDSGPSNNGRPAIASWPASFSTASYERVSCGVNAWPVARTNLGRPLPRGAPATTIRIAVFPIRTSGWGLPALAGSGMPGHAIAWHMAVEVDNRQMYTGRDVWFAIRQERRSGVLSEVSPRLVSEIPEAGADATRRCAAEGTGNRDSFRARHDDPRFPSDARPRASVCRGWTDALCGRDRQPPERPHQSRAARGVPYAAFATADALEPVLFLFDGRRGVGGNNPPLHRSAEGGLIDPLLPFQAVHHGGTRGCVARHARSLLRPLQRRSATTHRSLP